jgi:HAD superfamily hydrolase (TIGR01509 family)
MKTIVLDAMGVIYSVGDDVSGLLCPFIAEMGGSLDTERITVLYRAASLGQISAEAFWKAVAVDPCLEDEYLARHRLTNGILNLLKTLQIGGYPLWCLSNDVSEWSLKLRGRFGLAQFMRGFVISGDVGVRKPDRAIFEHLLKQSGGASDEIIFVDDNAANPDTAAAMGIQTILFTGEPRRDATHPMVHDCGDLLNLVRDKGNCENRS